MEKINEIKQSIQKIRPYINRDGGDVEFVDFDEASGVVTVKMLGACVGCHAVDQTVFYGIESLLLEEVAGVKEVKLDTSNWWYKVNIQKGWPLMSHPFLLFLHKAKPTHI